MLLLGNALICASTVLECSCCSIHRYVAAPPQQSQKPRSPEWRRGGTCELEGRRAGGQGGRLGILYINWDVEGIQHQRCSSMKKKSQLCIPRKGIAWSQSQFPQSCACERCVYIPRISPHIFLQQNSQTDRGNI